MSHSLPKPALARPRKPSFSRPASPPPGSRSHSRSPRHVLFRLWPQSKLHQLVACVILASVFLLWSLRRGTIAERATNERSGFVSGSQQYGARSFPVLPKDLGPKRTVPRSRTPAPTAPSSTFILSPTQEFSSLMTFLLSSPYNSLPLDTKASDPLDPNAILDVALPSDHGARNRFLDELTREAWIRWPVILIGRKGDSTLERLRTLLAHEGLMGRQTKGLSLLELMTTRPDHAVALSLIYRLTSRTKLPLLLVGGRVLGSYDDVIELDDRDQLSPVLSLAGIEVGKEKQMREDFEAALKTKEAAERKRYLAMTEELAIEAQERAEEEEGMAVRQELEPKRKILPGGPKAVF